MIKKSKLTGIILFLSSCISVYEPVGLEDMSGILVVDGMILDTGTTIQLSRTVILKKTAFSTKFDNVNNATIHVIDEENNVVAFAEQQYIDGKINPGVYAVNHTISFAPGMKYALDIRLEGKHYRSAFVSPVHTPEIEEVSWQLNDDKSIDIFVSTHDPTNQINHFRWAFHEAWEIRSKIFWTYRFDPDTRTVVEQSFSGDNRWYCWASDYSKSLLLASSAKYNSAVIKNHKIHGFRPGTSRYSYLYSILVKQYGLDNEAYLYFENLQRNMDESGSLFAPQPSEIIGNMQCISNPEETVIGYIFASTVSTYRLYIPMAQQYLNDFEDQMDCFLDVRLNPPRNPEQAYQWGLGMMQGGYVHIPCVECTFRGGTKTKPDYWPNDHQ